MSRKPLPLAVPDLSRFARTLGRALHARHALGLAPPSHRQLLNLMAQAQGLRSFQALQAAAQPMPEATAPRAPTHAAAPPPATHAEPAPELSASARKALGQFDAQGRLMRWPSKFSVQTLVMWVLWLRFDGRRRYREAEVNDILRAAHTFGDHATLRRELINHKLMSRKPDCSDYRKLPARPDAPTRALLSAWRSTFPDGGWGQPQEPSSRPAGRGLPARRAG